MAITPDLFDSPIARRRDPGTSQQAAAKYTKTKRIKDVDMMYELILQHPGLTAGEYARILKDRGMNWYKAARMPNRRISDLVKAERLIIGRIRKCDVTGDTAQTYFAKP